MNIPDIVWTEVIVEFKEDTKYNTKYEKAYVIVKDKHISIVGSFGNAVYIDTRFISLSYNEIVFNANWWSSISGKNKITKNQ